MEIPPTAIVMTRHGCLVTASATRNGVVIEATRIVRDRRISLTDMTITKETEAQVGRRKMRHGPFANLPFGRLADAVVYESASSYPSDPSALATVP